jgi:hypothetical protein
MTNDTLHRIYEDGQTELVGYCQEWYIADDPTSKQDYYEHNRAFYNTAKQKGLW